MPITEIGFALGFSEPQLFASFRQLGRYCAVGLPRPLYRRQRQGRGRNRAAERSARLANRRIHVNWVKWRSHTGHGVVQIRPERTLPWLIETTQASFLNCASIENGCIANTAWNFPPMRRCGR